MSQSLANERKIHISSDQMRRQRVLQDVGMPFLERQRSSLSDRLKHSEELRPIELPTLLRCEQKVRPVRLTLSQPSPQRRNFIK